MTMQVLDRLYMGELDDFEEFRKKGFFYLYYCTKCSRSFDSKTSLEKCKFCEGELKQLWSNPKVQRVEKNYRHFCTACDKNFISNEKLGACEMCGSRFIHVYEWERLGRDVLRTRLRRFLRRMKNLENFRMKLPQQTAKGTESPFPMPKMPRLFSKNEEEMPESPKRKLTEEKPAERGFSSASQTVKILNIKFSKNKEELPTR